MSETKTDIPAQETTGALPLLPTIDYDPGVPDLAEVVVDSEFLARVMAREGLSGDVIAGTRILFSTDTEIEEAETGDLGDATVTIGHFDRDHTVKVNLGSIKAIVDYSEGHISEEGQKILGSKIASGSVLHELGHLIADAKQEDFFDESLDYYGALVPEKVLGRVARRFLKMSPSRQHRMAADLHRKLEITKAMENPDQDLYENSPPEKFADELKKEAASYYSETGRYPVTVLFR